MRELVCGHQPLILHLARIIPSRDVAEQVRHIHRRHDYVVVGIRDVSNTSIFG
jgi:hypothetical protein